MQNVIVNDCIGGYLYRLAGVKFPNPFIWTAVGFESFLYLIQNYDSLDFEDFLIVRHPTDKRLFNIIIADKVTVKCPHWLFDIKYNKPTRVDSVNIHYNRIWLYIADKYTSRLARMRKLGVKPVFIMDFKDWLYCDKDKLKILFDASDSISYPLYVLVPYKEYDGYKVGNITMVYDSDFNTHTTDYRAKKLWDRKLIEV